MGDLSFLLPETLGCAPPETVLGPDLGTVEKDLLGRGPRGDPTAGQRAEEGDGQARAPAVATPFLPPPAPSVVELGCVRTLRLSLCSVSDSGPKPRAGPSRLRGGCRPRGHTDWEDLGPREGPPLSAPHLLTDTAWPVRGPAPLWTCGAGGTLSGGARPAPVHSGLDTRWAAWGRGVQVGTAPSLRTLLCWSFLLGATSCCRCGGRAFPVTALGGGRASGGDSQKRNC